MFTQKQLKEFVKTEFENLQLDPLKNPLIEKDQNHADKYQLFDLKWFESDMNIIMNIISSDDDGVTIQICGNVLLTRKYVDTESQNKQVPGKKFTLYTFVRSKDKEAKASIIMCHGYGETSDNFLETAIHHAMNGFEVHIVDFMG